MTINQAFEILARHGGIRAAHVITENAPSLSRISVWRMARALRRGVPVAKIIHKKWFYGLQFYTNRHTLDPRPDTETLVDAVISEYGANAKLNILDLGTGTGCIIAALLKNMPDAHGTATDVSRRALRVARHNMHSLGLCHRMRLVRHNFNNSYNFAKRFDIIISNPPYIAHGDTRVNSGAMHDPRLALYAKNNGMAAYESIAKNARDWICSDGKIYVEIGDGAGPVVRNIFKKYGWKFNQSFNDLAGIERVLVFKK